MKKSFFLSVIIIFTCVFYFAITDAQTPLPTIGNGLPFKPIVSQTAQSTTIKDPTKSTKPLNTLFWGKVDKLVANQIEEYESSDYECEVPGKSIDIKPFQGEISYIIPEGLKSITGYPLKSGQSIMGRQEGTGLVTCKKCEEKDGGFLKSDKTECVTETFSLPLIRLYGTSPK